jgi:hypothetical protein
MFSSPQPLVQLDRLIADLERRVADQRRGGDAFASGEILDLLEQTLMAMKTRKASLDRSQPIPRSSRGR